MSLRLRVSLTPQAVQRKRPGMGCWAPQPYGTRHSTAPSFSRALEGIFGHCGDTRCLLSGQPWERKLGLREWKCGFCSRFAEAPILSCVIQSPSLAGLPPLREGLSMQAPCVCPGHRRVAPSGPEPTAGPATQIFLRLPSHVLVFTVPSPPTAKASVSLASIAISAQCSDPQVTEGCCLFFFFPGLELLFRPGWP